MRAVSLSIVVTHDPGVARRADRVLILVDGRIVMRVACGSEIRQAMELLAAENGESRRRMS